MARCERPIWPRQVFNQAVASKEEPATSWSDSLWRMYRSSSSAVRFVAGGTKHDPSAFEGLLKELTDMTKQASQKQWQAVNS